MDWPRLWRALAPAEPPDERFRLEVRRLALPGLRAIAIFQVALAVVLLAGGMETFFAAAVMLTGAATFAAASIPAVAAHPRAVAALSVLSGAFWIGRGATVEYALAGTSVLLFAAAAVCPLRPLDALAIGCAIAAVASAAAPFSLAIAAFAAALNAIEGARRESAWEQRQNDLRVSETLAAAQVRAQLAESAAAIGKLAAAVTHEINTPMGALKSSIDTLLVLAARQATAPPEKQDRLLAMQADLRKSIEASAGRIRDVVARLQRFINLEEAEVKTADINELLSDVALLHQPELEGRIQLEMRLAPLPKLTCRPQLLTAVFSTLLSNSIKACNGAGSRIVISTRENDKNVEITFQDNGCGMAAEIVENIFDPSFRVAGERVSSGNWSLFNSRQIIFEHGGDIQIDSAEGQGTTISVTLPR